MTPGRVVLSRRAIEHTAVAVAVAHLGVARSTVSVRVHDDRGALGVEIAAPIAVPRPAHGGLGIRVVSDSERRREQIATDLHRLTGARVGTVRLRVTRARLDSGRRVR